MNVLKKARLQIVIAMAVFGTLSIFVRNIDLSSSELALLRAILATFLLGGYLLFKKEKITAKKKQLPLLFLSGAAIGINWILLFEAYRYTTVSVATLSYYFSPIIVTALCPILFHEKLTKKQLLCFVMSTLGVCLIISANGLQSGGSDLKGILFGLGAAFFYAMVVLFNKYIADVSGIQRTFLQFIAAVIVLLPYTLLTGGLHLAQLNSISWLNVLIVGLFHTGVCYCLYFSAIKELRGQEASILSYIDPLVAVVVSVTILGEPIAILQIIGGIMILAFALWNSFISQ